MWVEKTAPRGRAVGLLYNRWWGASKAWGAFGYTVEYVRGIQWRNPPRWPVLGPYLLLYLATTMFYWWPLALILKPLWYVYAALFVVSTALNITSHRAPDEPEAAASSDKR